MTKRTIDLEGTSTKDTYKLLSGLVVPRPIGWIGTTRANGSYNLAPFSFFNLVSSNPPTVLFSGGRHPDRPKDSVTLAEETGEFTVNIVSEHLVEVMNETAKSFDEHTDEFDEVGLTPIPGTFVDAPLVAESLANLECRVIDVIALGDEGQARLVLGNVVGIQVSEDLLDGTRINHDALRAVGRMAGSAYLRTADLFEVNRSG